MYNPFENAFSSPQAIFSVLSETKVRNRISKTTASAFLQTKLQAKHLGSWNQRNLYSEWYQSTKSIYTKCKTAVIWLLRIPVAEMRRTNASLSNPVVCATLYQIVKANFQV